MFNWWKYNSQSDPSFLLKLRRKLTKAETYFFSIIGRQLLDEFVRAFGLGEHFLSVIDKRKEIAYLRMQMCITRDMSIQTFIDIAQLELEDLQTGGQKVDFLQSKLMVEKHYKFQIDMHKTSVTEFYTYIKNLKN